LIEGFEFCPLLLEVFLLYNGCTGSHTQVSVFHVAMKIGISKVFKKDNHNSRKSRLVSLVIFWPGLQLLQLMKAMDFPITTTVV